MFCHLHTDDPDIDHVIARSVGGNATVENAQLTCEHCNRSKNNGVHPKTPPFGFVGSWPPRWWSPGGPGGQPDP